MVLRTEWVRCTERELFEGASNVPPQFVGFSERTQPTKRAFAVSGGGVNQYAGHRLAVSGISRIDPLRNRRTCVATLNRELPN